MTAQSYRADIDDPDPEAPCECGDCSWTGPASATVDIIDCILTPGDPSPVGRCPECGALAYIKTGTTFLIHYSSGSAAKQAGLPLAGTTVTIRNLADLQALVERMKAPVIVRGKADAYTPWWACWWEEDPSTTGGDEPFFSPEDAADWHIQSQPPKGWKQMPFLEVYNDLRE